jgi:hypothetical protein
LLLSLCPTCNLTQASSQRIRRGCLDRRGQWHVCLFITIHLQPHTHPLLHSTPLYQLVTHALDDKNNKTKFKLLYANVAEKDILLREELDELKKRFPNTFEIVYFLSQPGEDWKGPTGYISADTIKKHVGPADLKEKIKIFVCGMTRRFYDRNF